MIADLTGKTAIVTGGGQGIGRGISLTMAGQGADIAIADLPSGNGPSVAKEVEALGRKAMVIDLNVTDKAQGAAAIRRVIDDWEHLDILVNNAGVAGAPGSLPTQPGRDEDWELTWRVNVKGLADLTAAALQEDPALAGLQAYVEDSGEGRWTVHESVELGVPAPVITSALQARFRSRQDQPFGARLLAAMRNQFGGHAVRKAE